MLMYAFHRHPEMFVYDEHRNSKVFYDFRIRGFQVVQDAIQSSRFPVACFKPISDSHLIAEFVTRFPDAHHIWIYRRYEDVTNSSLRKFDAPTRAIRLVCTGKPGGGWFQEGVSEECQRVLTRVYRPELSDFDLGCLVWWARNKIILESGLQNNQNITLLRYETLVSNPKLVLHWLFERMNVTLDDRIGDQINTRSVGRYSVPPMSEAIRELCEDLTAELDNTFSNIASATGLVVDSR